MFRYKDNLPSDNLFCYSGKQKYLRLIERFIDQDNTLHQSYILDPQFSIILHQKQQISNLEKNEQQNNTQAEEVLYKIKDQKVRYYNVLNYKKYSYLYDFLIGREHWERSENALKVSTDAVSRKHTRLSYNNGTNIDSTVSILKHIIQESTMKSSKWRKLSIGILSKITQYLIEKPYYSVEDCGSRNGTFLLQQQSKKTQIKLGEEYEFEKNQYGMKPLKLLKEQGSRVYKMLRQFQQNWSQPCSKYRYSYQFVYNQQVRRQSLKESKQIFSVLLLQLYVSHQIKFYFWIVCKNTKQQFYIGQNRHLNISYNQTEQNSRYQSLRHGYIEFEKGRWWIASGKEDEGVWVKLQSNKHYVLDTKKNHHIRIAHLVVLQLQFINY